MQADHLTPLVAALLAQFGRAEFVDRAKDGFQDYGRWAYVRLDTDSDYAYTVDDNWLVGEYVAVAEDDCNVATTLYTVLENAGAEVTQITTIADKIYPEETGQPEPTREMFVAKIAFTLRSPKPNCIC